MSLTRKDVTEGAAEFGVATVVAVATVAVVILIVAGVWLFSVVTAGPKGAGDLHKDQQSAANREHWSATFNTLYQQIKADQGNLTVLKKAAEASGATEQDRVNYTGAQLDCRQTVGTYNADTATNLGGPWVPANLPQTLNADDYCGS